MWGKFGRLYGDLPSLFDSFRDEGGWEFWWNGEVCEFVYVIYKYYMIFGGELIGRIIGKCRNHWGKEGR